MQCPGINQFTRPCWVGLAKYTYEFPGYYTKLCEGKMHYGDLGNEEYHFTAIYQVIPEPEWYYLLG